MTARNLKDQLAMVQWQDEIKSSPDKEILSRIHLLEIENEQQKEKLQEIKSRDKRKPSLRVIDAFLHRLDMMHAEEVDLVLPITS